MPNPIAFILVLKASSIWLRFPIPPSNTLDTLICFKSFFAKPRSKPFLLPSLSTKLILISPIPKF